MNRHLKTWPSMFLLLWALAQATTALADAAAGQGIFKTKACGACHSVQGPVKGLPVERRAAAIKGPTLWFAGSKFKAEWLASWLAAPTPIRRVRFGTLIKGRNDHPALSPADAKQVAAYLGTLVDTEMPTGAVKAKRLRKRQMFKGEKLFSKKQVCFGCHEYPSRQGNIGGFTGPSLVGAGRRLRIDWIYAFIQNNLRYYPNGRMPFYTDKAFDPYTDKELKLLAQYISNL